MITIIILLILAGISIASLTNSGLFAKTQQAKQEQENAQIQENTTLSEYENWLANYIGGGTTSTPQEPQQPPVTLASKVNVGDYVQYIPDTVTTEAHNALISELGTYSGNTDVAYNTTTTTKQDTLNWRVLDKVKDENGNDCVRLISATPTKSTVKLYGFNGYNNAVYLLDKTCNTLYNKVGYTKNVQNLKIEDIEKYMVTKPTLSDTTFTPNDKNYPSILLQEANQTVNGKTGTLGLSQQTAPINQTVVQTATSWSLKNTNRIHSTTSQSFTDTKYYDLFKCGGTSSWLSSRSVYVYSNGVYFNVGYVYAGCVSFGRTYEANGDSGGAANGLLPVITINADVLIDTTDNSKDGSEVEKAYVFKNNV